mgnify:CR=1 FL=1
MNGPMRAIVGIAMLMIVGLAGQAWGGTATLTWTANTEADLAGYHIFRGTTAAVCSGTAILPPLLINSAPASVGKVTTFADTTVPAIDGILCWEISAFDTATTPNESGRSNRVSKTVNGVPPLAPSGLSVAGP